MVSNRKSARVKISTKAPPPKSLEVEPGNEASQDDVSLNNILDLIVGLAQYVYTYHCCLSCAVGDIYTCTYWNFTSVCYFMTVYLLVPVSRCTVMCTCVVQE